VSRTIGPFPPSSHAAHAHRRFWRSLAEARGNPDAPTAPASSIDRRRFLQAMAASLALAESAGCSRPPLEKIVPYREGPPEQTYGRPVLYASTLTRDAYGVGVLVACNMGRPTKIEGNPVHPASVGGTDVFAQASVLELWDPDRSQAVRERGAIAAWGAFTGTLQSRLRPLAAKDGEGLRVLTEATTSPTLAAQLRALLTHYPRARWHQWQPLNRDNTYAGATLAYGAPYEVAYRFDRARVVLALDADFLNEMPGCVRYARDFAKTRGAAASRESRSRLYALECTPTLTGANAEHRLPLRAAQIGAAAHAIAHALGVVADRPPSSVLAGSWLATLHGDLVRNRGASIVVAGERQPPAVHALAHAMNERLGNIGATVVVLPPVVAEPVDHARSIAELATDMHEGRVDALVVVGANPVYTAPVDLEFASALRSVPFKVHHGLYYDETARRCDWHIPAAHPLESWGDARAYDGTASLQQPGIAPLYGSRSVHELLAALAGEGTTSDRERVRAFWRHGREQGFDAWFTRALQEGVIAGTSPAPQRPALRRDLPPPSAAADAEIELVFAPDSRIGDGRWANHAWLQELPKPLSQLTWDNAALLAPGLAKELGIANEDVIELRLGGHAAEAPAWVMPGMPSRSVTIALGFGRPHAGRVGTGVGVDAYALRTGAAPWFAPQLSIRVTGRRHELACTQTHSRMEGRDLVRWYSADQAAACKPESCGTPDYRRERSLYRSPDLGPYAWALSIDLSSCIGCGACTIACQAENNIPVVGRDEVRNGREMHWIRVDRYYEGSVDNPHVAFQPVPCMQCEHAPCELVCPVEASVHDAQGINVQVYNRCVGTRFCSNNCPYKVRRFNFLQYTRDEPLLNAQRNPQVTVRMRGVMEKCNYCLQRITTARIDADREGRELHDGDVVTACAAACPTRAIVFGDLNDPASEVTRRKRSPLDYALLAELNTRPRTTYLARVTNPASGLEGP
jgi:molybdopterin-containing oxidoreductase family iron-sulfur binding subunit